MPTTLKIGEWKYNLFQNENEFIHCLNVSTGSFMLDKQNGRVRLHLRDVSDVEDMELVNKVISHFFYVSENYEMLKQKILDEGTAALDDAEISKAMAQEEKK